MTDKEIDFSTLHPLHDNIIVRREQEENTTKGGIIIPDMVLEPPDIGVVLAVGEGKLLGDGTRRPMECRVGDRVMFGKYCGHAIKIEGQDFLSICEIDIMAILEPTTEQTL